VNKRVNCLLLAWKLSIAANILSSPRAVQMTVFFVHAFVRTRSMMKDKGESASHLSMLEEELKECLDVHQLMIVSILQRILGIINPPKLPRSTHKTIESQIKE
jgi:hypothetical protein